MQALQKKKLNKYEGKKLVINITEHFYSENCHLLHHRFTLISNNTWLHCTKIYNTFTSTIDRIKVPTSIDAKDKLCYVS
jgi:hypothetical protein